MLFKLNSKDASVHVNFENSQMQKYYKVNMYSLSGEGIWSTTIIHQSMHTTLISRVIQAMFHSLQSLSTSLITVAQKT